MVNNRLKSEYVCIKYSPILGIAMCIKWCSSWLFASSWRPSRSLSKTSWGTLHPHPLRSANRVSRKWASRSWARGSKGRRIARALVLAGWPAANSNWAACKIVLKNCKNMKGNKTREIVLYQDWDFVIWRENKEKKVAAVNWTDLNWAACKI